MSLSNPHESAPNPSSRWFEWNGEHGKLRYYDKDLKQNVEVALPFTFILLDQLGCVRGWHDASQSGIDSNEVRDTRQDVLVVKAFKGGVIAEGLYKDIKYQVNVAGGKFNTNCYIAYKNGEGLKIGALQFKGAALRAWSEFAKAHRAEFYKKAITIHGTTEGQKGRVMFHVPALKTTDIAPATLASAVELDKTLQEWLASYLKRNTRERVEATAQHVTDEQLGGSSSNGDWTDHGPTDIEDPPF
jgi:hypothetical protein